MSPISFTPEYVQNYINRESERRQSNKVLHGHPGPGHWKPLDQPIESLLEKRQDAISGRNTSVNLYVGTPFCIKTKPERCGFCLFPSEDYTGKKEVEEYLAYLKKDFRLHQPYYGGDRLASIYFGGGTPNLYHPSQYGTLMSYVDELYGGVPEGIEITLEGIPQLFTEAKIKAMSEAGINRISMGVQQISDRLIRHSGRRQTRAQVMDAVELCHKYQMANSMDLIYGWPEQTPEDMLADLHDAVSSGVHHITHYELNIAGRSDFAKPAQRAILPTISDNINMYHIAQEYLSGAGYEQVTVYDWRKIPTDAETNRLSSYDYEDKLRTFDRTDNDDLATSQCCAIGFSGISCHINSMGSDTDNWVYMNSRNTKDYKESLANGNFPVERGFMYTPEDVRIGWLFQSMQTMAIDTNRYKALFGESIDSEFAAVWDSISARGWIEKTPDSIRFTGDGQYYIPMLQALLASKRIAQLRTANRPKRIADIPVSVEAV